MARMVRTKICEEIGDRKFCLLVYEANDESEKEQMAIALRFVDYQGSIKEPFFDIMRVEDTTTLTLKKHILDSLARYNLHFHDIRGQEYDGASNMCGEWNGLQALFLRDCSYAYYVHCFAHRLQLALVASSSKEISIWLFFSRLTTIINLIVASPKLIAELQSMHADFIAQKIANEERKTGRGANLMGNLQHARTTRWSSQFDSICSLVDMYYATAKALYNLKNEGPNPDVRGKAYGCFIDVETFDFIFILHLMHRIMGITHLLCQALQYKSQDIWNVLDSVATTKVLLQRLRNESFDHLLAYVESNCRKYGVDILDMNASYKEGTGRSCQQRDLITVRHHYHYDVFNSAIDYQLEELNSRFNDNALEILKLASALQPNDNFKSFNFDHICLLAQKFYYDDFSEQDMHHLRCQLEHYEVNALHHESFQGIQALSDLLKILI